ncbi:MAG TPA: hypothetical protein VLG69_00865 [Candidatus Andersenbacteria bacterium]|nr:hypothetical protein [Candidatus Andersenbacteria bacterium]
MNLARKLWNKRTFFSILLFLFVPIIALSLDIIFLHDIDVNSILGWTYGAIFLFIAGLSPITLLISIPTLLFPYALIGLLISTKFQKIGLRKYIIILICVFFITILVAAIIPTAIKVKEYNDKYFIGYSQQDCDKLPEPKQNECSLAVLRHRLDSYDPSLTPSICNTIPAGVYPEYFDKNNEHARSECWHILSVIHSRDKTSDVSFCNQAPHDNLYEEEDFTKHACIETFAEKKKDISLCNLLPNEDPKNWTSKEFCIRAVTDPVSVYGFPSKSR